MRGGYSFQGTYGVGFSIVCVSKRCKRKHWSYRRIRKNTELNNYSIHDKASNDLVFPIGFTNSETGLNTYNQKRERDNKRFNELAKLAGPDIKSQSSPRVVSIHIRTLLNIP